MSSRKDLRDAAAASGHDLDNENVGASADVDAPDEEPYDPSFFEEEVECATLLTSVGDLLPNTNTSLLPSVGQDPNGAAAMLELRFVRILDRYQDSPHLLHPYLEELMRPLVALLLRYLPNAADLWARETTAALSTSTEAATNTVPSNIAPAAAPAADVAEPVEPTLVISSTLGQDLTMFDADAPKTPLHLVCKALYYLIKTAGEKSCTSHFPNDVSHYEDVFYTLQAWVADATRQREWEVRYCLLLWISNLVLVPFSLALIDTNQSEGSEGSTDDGAATSAADQVARGSRLSLSDATLLTASRFLADTSKCREAAALLIARLLTRPDSAHHRSLFFDFATFLLQSCAMRTAGGCDAPVVPPNAPWAFLMEGTQSAFRSLLSQPFLAPGLLLAIAKTMKLGRREELAPFAPPMLRCVVAVVEQHQGDSLLCKTGVKVGQRLVLSMLKRRSAGWRYSRHVDSLSAHLGAVEEVAQDGRGGEDDDAGDGFEGDEESLETGIGFLLEAIGHKDTVVRWSAAKGIGRVCERLPAAFAEEVMGAVLNVFDNAYSDAHWHGGLLTIAELCRRSLVSIEMLKKVVPLVAQGLAYDLSKGTYSVGTHVRDAACYTCWSIARAYDADDLVHHVQQLSVSLIVTALFDREVNVRRAAAAAFQESVGRLGNFEHGIELVTTVDFFSLASLRNAYTVVAPTVSQYDTYRNGMLKELVGVKLLHWDRDIRQVAAEALGLVAMRVTDPIIVDEVLPELLRRIDDATVATRHGAILAIAELVRRLPSTTWTATDVALFIQVLVKLDASHAFSTRGGVYLRQACCTLLHVIATQSLPLPNTLEVIKMGGRVDNVRTLALIFSFFKESWENILESVQCAAAEAFRAVAEAYFVRFLPTFHGRILMDLYEGCLPEPRVLRRRGFLAAVGGLPTMLINAPWAPGAAAAEVAADTSETPPLAWEAFLPVLQQAALLSPSDLSNPELADADTRRNAVRALAQVLVRIEPTQPAVTPAWYAAITEGTLMTALQDYATDARGDVGSFVRLAVLEELPSVLTYGLAAAAPLCGMTTELCVLQGVMRCVLEKLDRVRAAAGKVLVRVLLEEPGNNSLWAVEERGVRPRDEEGQVRAELHLFRKHLRSLVEGRTEQRSGSSGGHADPLVWHRTQQVMSSIGPFVLVHCPLTLANAAMEGLLVAAGDLTEHVSRPASAALLSAFHHSDSPADGGAPAALPERLSKSVMAVLAAHEHEERLLRPASRVLDLLINSGVFAVSQHRAVLEMLRKELKHFALNIIVLLAMVPLLADVCRSPDLDVRGGAWTLTLTMIASRYPKVRARVAADLYTSLLVLTSGSSVSRPGLPLEGCKRAMEQLMRVQWDGSDVARTRAARNELYGMLEIDPPATMRQAASSSLEAGEGAMQPARVTRGAVAATYKSLVQETGY